MMWMPCNIRRVMKTRYSHAEIDKSLPKPSSYLYIMRVSLACWLFGIAQGYFFEPCRMLPARGSHMGSQGWARGWRGAGWNTGVASREGSWLVYLQGRVETERLRGVGQAPGWVSWREVRAALWSALVGVCQEKQVRMQGGGGEADGIYVYFAILGSWCVGKSRNPVWWITSMEGRETCEGFFVFFSQIISSKIVRFYKALGNKTSHALSNLGMRQTLGLCRRLATFLFISRPSKSNQPPHARNRKGGPWHPCI